MHVRFPNKRRRQAYRKPPVLYQQAARDTGIAHANHFRFLQARTCFLSLFMEKWIDSAVEMTGIDRRTLNALAGEIFAGTGKLLTEEGFSPNRRAGAVPGGITAQALALLDSNLNGLFYQLIQTTRQV